MKSVLYPHYIRYYLAQGEGDNQNLIYQTRIISDLLHSKVLIKENCKKKLKYSTDGLDLTKLRTNWHVRDATIKVLPDEDDRKLVHFSSI